MPNVWIIAIRYIGSQPAFESARRIFWPVCYIAQIKMHSPASPDRENLLAVWRPMCSHVQTLAPFKGGSPNAHSVKGALPVKTHPATRTAKRTPTWNVGGT